MTEPSILATAAAAHPDAAIRDLRASVVNSA